MLRRHAQDLWDWHIVVSLDGEPLATLLFGEAVTREVATGSHRLRAHNTPFWKTRQLELQPGDHARFIVINRPGTYALLGLLGAGPLYLTFERVVEDAA